MKQITTTNRDERRAESHAVAIAARRAEMGRTTPTYVALKRTLRTDARTGHATSVAAAVGVSAC